MSHADALDRPHRSVLSVGRKEDSLESNCNYGVRAGRFAGRLLDRVLASEPACLRPEDVATREAHYERLLAELEHSLDRDTVVYMRTLWQQRARAQAELRRFFAEQGIVMDSDYYRMNAITELLRMLKTDSKPNQPAAGNAGFASWFQAEHHRPGVPEPGRSLKTP